MIKNLMETSTVNLSTLLYNGKTYKVPAFQRDYSWREENWEDLWFDILQLYEDKDNFAIHYMGPLIFKPTEETTKLIVIDGQQRLATLILIGLAGIKFLQELVENNIEKDSNIERLNTFKRFFIGTKEATRLYFKNKLELNRNNNLFFKDHICRFKKPISIYKLRRSNQLLYNAFSYFYNEIKKRFKDDNGYHISLLLEKIMGERLIFTQILVQDDLSAYNVFETLNARGIELAPTDLLKNYLFSLIGENEDLSAVEEKWQEIVDLVEFEKFTKFLRYYLNSYRELIRTRNLYKILRREIRDASQVLDFIDEIQKYALIYKAINDPTDDLWNEFSNKDKIKKHLNELKILKVTQHIPLIFAVFDASQELLESTLRITKIIAFRFLTISGMNSNEFEYYFNQAALKVRSGEIKTPKQLFDFLKPLYIDDNRFEQNFIIKEFNTRKHKTLVKYILTQIENHLQKTTYDYNDAEITIEHVLPESLPDHWLKQDFDPKEASRYVYRLGNMTLLEPHLNRRSADLPFDKKRPVLLDSKFKITHIIVEKYENWTPEAIEKHQTFLARLAKNIWRLDY